MVLHAPRYGRLLDDFVPGAAYAHPWEVTVDAGMGAVFAASFQDAIPTFASRRAALALGLRDRPVHPHLLLNLALSFSVHDVSEQAIANLAYIDVGFPSPCYEGDTVTAASQVLGVKPVSSGDKGVVHVRTELVTHEGNVVCSFERKALVRAGRSVNRPADPPPPPSARQAASTERGLPFLDRLAPEPCRFAFAWDDLGVGDVIAHEVGRTISEAEHMQLATLARNSHPLHFDERYCRQGSFAKTRVVYGGLVLAWVLSLASRDTAGNAVWELGLDDGAHPSGVLAGDTLFAASRVIAKRELSPEAGVVTLRVVGLKNAPARALLDAGADLFTAELGKTEGKVAEKVVEITRTLLLRRRPR